MLRYVISPWAKLFFFLREMEREGKRAAAAAAAVAAVATDAAVAAATPSMWGVKLYMYIKSGGSIIRGCALHLNLAHRVRSSSLNLQAQHRCLLEQVQVLWKPHQPARPYKGCLFPFQNKVCD